LLLGLALAGCAGGTETGNPSLTGQLSYSGISSAPTKIGVRSGGGVANVKNAWFALGEVTVSSAGDCGVTGNRAFSVRALGIGDHAAGVHNATDFEGAAGAFCSVELPFQSVAADDTKAPAELRGHGIVVAGELADGTPFLLSSDQAPLVRLQGEANGFEFSAQAPNALIAFDFATWLKGVDWAAATVDAGRISVDAGSNTDILRDFESQLAAGVALYRDSDGDGVLDAAPVLLANAP
jgi:hypothetical protein